MNSKDATLQQRWNSGPQAFDNMRPLFILVMILLMACSRSMPEVEAIVTKELKERLAREPYAQYGLTIKQLQLTKDDSPTKDKYYEHFKVTAKVVSKRGAVRFLYLDTKVADSRAEISNFSEAAEALFVDPNSEEFVKETVYRLEYVCLSDFAAQSLKRHIADLGMQSSSTLIGDKFFPKKTRLVVLERFRTIEQVNTVEERLAMFAKPICTASFEKKLVIRS